MKKMKIEKQLIFADHVNSVQSLDVQEALTYKHEEDGIRAMGPLYIKGTYEGEEGIEKFAETLEMDILAPTEKLNGEQFFLEIAEFQGDASDDGIAIHITLHIHGLKENPSPSQAGNRPQQIAEPVVMPKQPEPAVPEQTKKVIVPIKEYPKPEPVQPISAETKESVEEDIQEPVKTINAADEFEDLFPDAESTYTSYRIIVAKPNDTYAGIAQRYEVDEVALRNTNKNKDILPKTLVILPFAQK